jgi:hypothetical protein
MDSQGENSIHNLPHIADFGLKCCILKEDTKNNISGGSTPQNDLPWKIVLVWVVSAAPLTPPPPSARRITFQIFLACGQFEFFVIFSGM